MKKKTVCALALCAALSAGAVPVPVPQLDAPVTLAAAADSFTDASIQFLPLTKRTMKFWDGDQTGELLTSRWTTIDFLGDGFAEIASAIADYNAKENRDAEEANVQMAADARQERAERMASGSPFYGPFERTRDIYVRRADSRVVSFLESVSSYTGGVHGNYGVLGQNFDARTGKQLSLSDVCPKTEGLIAAIIAQLGFDYPDAPFMKSGSTLMQDTVRQWVSDGVVSWTLDPRGVTFYFNPYVIGSYAEGIYTVTLLFSQHPELFAEYGYGYGPATYATELQPYLVTRLSDSPRDHRLTVSGDENGITITFGGETIRDACSVRDIRPVVVEVPDRRHYLYVDCFDRARDQRVIRVYDLNLSEPACIGVQPLTLLASPLALEHKRDWYVITNPADFMATSTEREGLHPPDARLRCRIGSDGRIEIIQ